MTDKTDIKALRKQAETAKVCGGMFAISGEKAIALLDQLEAERQRADAAESYARERDYENESIALTVGRLRIELAALRGTQEPVAWLNDAYLGRGVVDGEAGRGDAGPGYIPVYRERHPKPVVVLSDCTFEAVSHMAHWYSEGECVAWVSGVEHAKKQMQAAGIVVKDGE